MLCCVWGYFMMIINNENKYIRWRNKKKFSSRFHFASSSFASTYTDFPPFLSFLIIKKQKKMNIRKNFIHFEHIMKIISSFFASFFFPPCLLPHFRQSSTLNSSVAYMMPSPLILSADGSILPFLLLLVLMCVHTYIHCVRSHLYKRCVIPGWISILFYFF